MRRILDHSQKLRLGQIQCSGLPDIPAALLCGQLRLHDDHVLRPIQMKRFAKQFRHIAVQLPEVSHSAHIARREAGHIRVLFSQELRSGYRCALLRAGADGLADLAVQLHLRQIRFHDSFQFGKHCAVIHSFSDIHSFSFPAHSA